MAVLSTESCSSKQSLSFCHYLHPPWFQSLRFSHFTHHNLFSEVLQHLLPYHQQKACWLLSGYGNFRNLLLTQDLFESSVLPSVLWEDYLHIPHSDICKKPEALKALNVWISHYDTVCEHVPLCSEWLLGPFSVISELKPPMKSFCSCSGSFGDWRRLGGIMIVEGKTFTVVTQGHPWTESSIM